MANRKYYWTTASGHQVDVDTMDINHLRNVLKMIIRNKENQHPVVKSLGNIESNFLEEAIREIIEMSEDGDF